MTYSQLCKVIPSSSKPTAYQNQNCKNVKDFAKLFDKKSFTSLHPEFIKEELPKKKASHNIPSQQRQILIEKYVSKSETKQSHKFEKSFENIWHQTLSKNTDVEIKSLRHSNVNSQKSSMTDFGRDIRSAGLPNSAAIRIEENLSKISSPPTSAFFSKKEPTTATAENESYQHITRKMEALANSLKDFYKVLFNTQQSYKKTDAEQKQLWKFTTTFIKEVDELEKIPKALNGSRLKTCIVSLETKIEEIAAEKELISEQLDKLYDQIGKKPSNEKFSILGPRATKTKGFLSNNSSFYESSHIRRSVPTAGGLEVQTSNLNQATEANLGCISEGVSFLQVGDFLEQVSAKTHHIKTEVQNLQNERLQFQIHQRKGLKRSPHPRSNNGSPLRSSKANTVDGNSPKSGRGTVLSQKLPSDCEKPEGFTTLVQLNESTPKEKDYVFDFEVDDGLNDYVAIHKEEEDENIQIKQIILGLPPRRPRDRAERQNTPSALYQHYERILKNIEEKLKAQLQQMKLFQKDVDEEYQPQSNSLDTQINSCFQYLIDEFAYLNNVDYQETKTTFFEYIAENYERYLDLHSSNYLKLTSVQSLLNASVDKILKLQVLTNEYTPNELTDKMLRQEYEQSYNSIKHDLQNDRKTLLFLTEQLERPIASYKIDAIKDPSIDQVTTLVEKSKMLLRVLYNLEKFPSLEDEFNEKSTMAYNKCRANTDLIASLREVCKAPQEAILSAENYKEAENAIKRLEHLKIKITSLQNEMSLVSRLSVLEEIMVKPMLVIIKLVKKITSSQNELKSLLSQLKENLVNKYNAIIKASEDTEKQLESYIKRTLNTNNHLNFNAWRQNYALLQSILKSMQNITNEIKLFDDQKYPSSVTLFPKPSDKLQVMFNLEQRTNGVLKTIQIGQMFEDWDLQQTFKNLQTSSLREKLDAAYQKIIFESNEKEKILVELRGESEALRKVIIDVLKVLSQLRFILGKTFDLEDQIHGEYKEFEDANLGQEINLLDPTVNFEKNRERFPQLFSALSIDLSPAVRKEYRPPASFLMDGGDMSPASPLGRKSLKRQVTLGLVKTLPALENTEEQYPVKLVAFIQKIKKIFDEFLEEVVMPYSVQHAFFHEICHKFKQMCDREINLLQEGHSAVYDVQVNHIYYIQEIKPLTHVHKYLHVLNSWRDKMETLGKIREKMGSNLEAVKKMSEKIPLRGGINQQVTQYKQVQEMVSNSINIVMDLLHLGTKLNQKDLTVYLGHAIRIEEMSLEEYIKVFERRFYELYDGYKTNNYLIEEGTESLLEDLQEFLEKLIGILTLSQVKYKNIFKTASDGLKPFNGKLLPYIEKLYIDMKEFADTYCVTLNEISQMIYKPTWLIKALDNFYRKVIIKDLGIFSKLYKETQALTQFTDEIQQGFIQQEIVQEAIYKKIDLSDPTYCDSQVAKASAFYKSLNDYCTIEEITSRPELKNIITAKMKELLVIKKVLSMFAVIYSMGRKFNDYITILFQKKVIFEIYENLSIFDPMIDDMLRHLIKASEDAKTLDKEHSTQILGTNLEPIVKDQILRFYSECKRCFESLREYLVEIVTFEHELTRKYKRQVLLLRDDWTAFLKENVVRNFVNLDKRVFMIEVNYPEFKGKLQAYFKEVQNQIREKKTAYLETLKRVEYLNENFFNEWFFNYTQEEADSGDQLYAQLKKLIRNIRQQKYKEQAKLCSKIHKISAIVARAHKNVSDLAHGEFVAKVFDGIKDWAVVEDYNLRNNLSGWIPAFDFALQQLLHQGPTSIREQAQTLEEFRNYLHTQGTLILTDIQEEFLEAVYLTDFPNDDK